MTNPLNSLASEWSTLNSSAANKDLKVDPNVAYTCGKLCVDALNNVLGLQGVLSSLEVKPTWFGNDAALPGLSGERLAGAFDQRRVELDPILTKHAQIVTDMGNTFVNAGKTFMATDAHSASYFGDPQAYFSEIAGGLATPKPTAMHPPNPNQNTAPAASWVPPTTYASGGSNTYGPSSSGYPVPVYAPPSAGQTTSTPGPNANSNEPTSFNMLPKYGDNAAPGQLTRALPPKLTDTSASLQWDNFQALGSSIDWPAVYDVGERWMWFNQQLKSISDTLYNGIVANINSDTWTGRSADAANKAISDYSTETARLLMAQYFMSDNMVYTTTWLTYTKGYMPTGPMPQGKAGTARLNQIRQYYDDWYATGYADSAGNIPMMPTPSPVTTTPTGPSPTGTSPTGTSPTGTSPTGGPTGGSGSNNGGSSNGGNSKNGGSNGGTGSSNGAGSKNTNLNSGGSLGTGPTNAGLGANAGSALPTGSNANAAAAGQAAAQAAQTPQQQEQMAMQGLQQGLQVGQQALQQGLQAAQQALQNVPGSRPNPFQGMEAKATGAGPISAKSGPGAGASGLGGGGAAGLGGAGSPDTLAKPDPLARLFPRASLPSTPGTTADTPTAAGAMPFPPGGAPGMAGAPGLGQGQEKQRKRAKYLESGENLAEAMGNAPATFKPVVGEQKSKAEEYAQGMEVYGPRVDRVVGGTAQGLPTAPAAFYEPDTGRRDLSVREEPHSGPTVHEPGQHP